MFTGIAVLGVLAGSLASLFNLEAPSEDEHSAGSASTEQAGIQPVHAELAALQTQLQAVERRLGELAELARAGPGEPG
jgi:hypothetical protein